MNWPQSNFCCNKYKIDYNCLIPECTCSTQCLIDRTLVHRQSCRITNHNLLRTCIIIKLVVSVTSTHRYHVLYGQPLQAVQKPLQLIFTVNRSQERSKEQNTTQNTYMYVHPTSPVTPAQYIYMSTVYMYIESYSTHSTVNTSYVYHHPNTCLIVVTHLPSHRRETAIHWTQGISEWNGM